MATIYDGRKKEPVNLSCKIPRLFAGTREGVLLLDSHTKVLHITYRRLIDASIKHLKRAKI